MVQSPGQTVVVDGCDVIEEGKPVFKLGGSFVVNFSSSSKELMRGHTGCYALNILLERYRGEGRKMGAKACPPV